MWSASWALKWSCLPLSPFMWGVGVGWCGGLLGLCSGLVSRCLSWALKWSCLPSSPVVSGCLPSCEGWVLVGVVGFLGSEVVLSPVVSGCPPSCVSLHVGGGCWLVWPPSWALKWSCLPSSPVVSGCLPSCEGWVLVGVVGFLGSEVVLSPVVCRCLRLSPFMWGVGVGWCGRLFGL